MTSAQVALAVLTGLVLVCGSALVHLGSTVAGAALLVVGVMGYLGLLGMIVSDRR